MTQLASLASPAGSDVLDRSLSACSRCGLCLHACPTFQLTNDERQSPRGRIQLMSAVADGRVRAADARSAIDSCLRCGKCYDACPTGVELAGSVDRYFATIDPQRVGRLSAGLAVLRTRLRFLLAASRRRLRRSA